MTDTLSPANATSDLEHMPAYAVTVQDVGSGYGYQTGDPSIKHGIHKGSMRMLTATADLAGGNATPSHVNALPIPAWCQLIDDYPNKTENSYRDRYATTDCGSQASAMAIYSARGIEIPEGIVRDYISDCVGGLNQGLTTADDLVRYLRSPHVNFRNARAVTQPWPQVQHTIQDELAAKRPVLILGHWYVGTLHWEVARSYDALQGLGTNDPWDGKFKGITWQAYASRVNTGVLVLVGERAIYG